MAAISSIIVIVAAASSVLQQPRQQTQQQPTLERRITKPLRSALRSNAARHLVAGAAAGAFSNTIVAPLDIVRINLMVSTQTTNVVAVARNIYAQGGMLEFWRGNTADVMRAIPSSAVRFYSFVVYKATLPRYLTLAHITSPAVTSVLAGSFAGMTAMALLFPLDTVRTQLATSQGGASMIAFTRGIVAKNGVQGLYRGLPTSLLCACTHPKIRAPRHARARTRGHLSKISQMLLLTAARLLLARVRMCVCVSLAAVFPYFGLRFGVYDILRRYHATLTDGAPIEARFSAAFGFASGFTASGLTFPMEVVRRRAMIGSSSGNPLVAARSIVQAEGMAGLYKGYGVNVVKVAPSSAITFFTYEMVRRALDSFVEVDDPKSPKSQEDDAK